MEVTLEDILSWVCVLLHVLLGCPECKEVTSLFIGYFPKLCFLASNFDG